MERFEIRIAREEFETAKAWREWAGNNQDMCIESLTVETVDGASDGSTARLTVNGTVKHSTEYPVAVEPLSEVSITCEQPDAAPAAVVLRAYLR